MPNDTQMKKAVLYRMVMPKHTCPFGLKSKDLLEREGFEVEDHYLETREDTDAFMREHDVNTTPQTFIDDERIGGYDDLQVHFGKKDPEADDTTYQPIIALFSIAALLALAFAWVALPSVFAWQALGWFISISMVLLGLQKLKDIESFSTMFLNYDQLASRFALGKIDARMMIQLLNEVLRLNFSKASDCEFASEQKLGLICYFMSFCHDSSPISRCSQPLSHHTRLNFN